MTPKTHGCLNTLHPNPRVEFTTCWGCVEELLLAGELWMDHKKDIFFPCSSTTTCANRPLGVEQKCVRVPRRDSRMNTARPVIMTFKRRSKLRMGMRLSDERSNYESIDSSCFEC
ncbi:hypothetical protein Taro_020644 [Colocasia esculenta]|uniref:Uncharacterized protein n=1 Tax=Colocasia esculenta TaxID=4460 RepID=A0A843V069_COLES|nr:hypothetical protein [Colocasia esculenta]